MPCPWKLRRAWYNGAFCSLQNTPLVSTEDAASFIIPNHSHSFELERARRPAAPELGRFISNLCSFVLDKLLLNHCSLLPVVFDAFGTRLDILANWAPSPLLVQRVAIERRAALLL